MNHIFVKLSNIILSAIIVSIIGKSCFGSELDKPIWEDQKKMAIYFQIIEEIKDKTGLSCFESWPSPSENYYRTPDHLFLETFKNLDDSENMQRLWTPLGGVNIFTESRWDFDKIKENYELREVTNDVKSFSYSNDPEYNTFEDGLWNSTFPYPDRHHLYLFTRFGSHQLVDNPMKPLIVFSKCMFSKQFKENDSNRCLSSYKQ